MKQNYPTPGWRGNIIPATRGGPEKYDDTTWPTRDGPETRIPVCKPGRPVCRTDRSDGEDIAVGFPEWMAMPSQRIGNAAISVWLQPHEEKMWLKPVTFGSSGIRQLKQTAMDNLHSPNLQGFGNLEGLKSKCRSKARDPAGHPPEKVCRSGTGMERALFYRTGRRDGTRLFRRRHPLPGKTAYSIPAGLHVYRKGKHVVNAAGVEYPLRYLYKHLIPAWSADRPLKSCDDIDPGRRKPATNQPVHPPEWEWYAERKPEVGSTKMEAIIGLTNAVRSNDAGRFRAAADLSACAVPDNVNSGNINITGKIPEGLHVYNQTVSRENTTPGGVVRTCNLLERSGNPDISSGQLEFKTSFGQRPPVGGVTTSQLGGYEGSNRAGLSFNAVRSNDADRFGAAADLSNKEK